MVVRAWVVAMLAAGLLTMAGCGADRRRASRDISDRERAPTSLREIAKESRYTVLVFFSATCPCQLAHDERLRALFDAYHARGVRFLAIDSEADSTAERDALEGRTRRYPFPILRDEDGVLADAADARYATFSVILDHEGVVRYRGGIDSDRTHLTKTAQPYLRNALDDLVAGREPAVPEAKTLGCALRRR